MRFTLSERHQGMGPALTVPMSLCRSSTLAHER